MSVHPLDDGALAAQFDAAAEDPQAALDTGLFAIVSKDRANRAVWRLGRELADLDSDEVLYSTEIQRLDQWIADRRRRVTNIRRFVEGLCEAFHAPILEHDKSRKTIKLPAGELQARKGPDSVEITDLGRFLDAQADGSPLVRVKREPDKPAVLRHVKDTGELPEGVTYVEGEVAFKVRPH